MPCCCASPTSRPLPLLLTWQVNRGSAQSIVIGGIGSNFRCHYAVPATALHHTETLLDEVINRLFALQEVAMRTWKIVALGAALTAALIAGIAHKGSGGFARGGVVADCTTNAAQQIQRASPVTNRVVPPEGPNTGKTPDPEPWGPSRATC